ncbi:sugar phosphate isomerase/epimerase [Kocuria sp.]|uniref:sugar phosphate isomerase/epimerase family protein n=1 Tax=Kocuria sp. TaxID=1871328 RepID=UPI0026DB7B18|nr:sugar phosphate isomerase/epimerase family protein [Kocuria sp.]MDO4919606.1 sugar phosphate isomerase/epimerase family protein [Kocuria sp.]
MSVFPLPFAMNEFTTQPWTFEEDLEHYAAAGVEHLELCEAKLDDDREHEQLEALRHSGLTVCSVQPAVRTATPSVSQPEPRKLDERIAAYRRSIERLAPEAPGAVFVTNTGPALGGDMHAAMDDAVQFHRAVMPVALDLGVRLAIEPLNPISLNQETCIWTYAQAVEFIERVGSPDLGICVDTWNLWQDPRLVDGLKAHPELISILQVSDWRTPRSGMDRRSIGTGDIPTGELLHAVVDAGYTGPCVLEIFSQDVPDSLYDTDLQDLITRNRTALQDAWDAAPGAPSHA